MIIICKDKLVALNGILVMRDGNGDYKPHAPNMARDYYKVVHVTASDTTIIYGSESEANRDAIFKSIEVAIKAASKRGDTWIDIELEKKMLGIGAK